MENRPTPLGKYINKANIGVKMTDDREIQVRKLIASTLAISLDLVQDDLGVGDIPEWDSLAHMRLITALEVELGVVLDVEQSLDIEDVRDITDAVLESR